MKHSEAFLKVKYWYDFGYWTEDRVRNAVGARYITKAEYKEITGKDY